MNESEKNISKNEKNTALNNILSSIVKTYSDAKASLSNTLTKSYINLDINKKYGSNIGNLKNFINTFIKNHDEDDSNDQILKLSLTIVEEKTNEISETLATLTIKP